MTELEAKECAKQSVSSEYKNIRGLSAVEQKLLDRVCPACGDRIAFSRRQDLAMDSDIFTARCHGMYSNYSITDSRLQLFSMRDLESFYRNLIDALVEELLRQTLKMGVKFANQKAKALVTVAADDMYRTQVAKRSVTTADPVQNKNNKDGDVRALIVPLRTRRKLVLR